MLKISTAHTFFLTFLIFAWKARAYEESLWDFVGSIYCNFRGYSPFSSWRSRRYVSIFLLRYVQRIFIVVNLLLPELKSVQCMWLKRIKDCIFSTTWLYWITTITKENPNNYIIIFTVWTSLTYKGLYSFRKKKRKFIWIIPGTIEGNQLLYKDAISNYFFLLINMDPWETNKVGYVTTNPLWRNFFLQKP